MARQSGLVIAEKPTKRRYAQSCEVCRRQKKRCEGRDDTGLSLCTYCPRHGLECNFPAPYEQSKLDAAVARGDTYESFIRDLVGLSPGERERRLTTWLYQHRPATAGSDPVTVTRPRKRQRLSPVTPELPVQPVSLSKAEALLTLAETSALRLDTKHGATLPQWLTHCMQMLDNSIFASPFSPRDIEVLLDHYFCYHAPRFRAIERDQFMRALQENDSAFTSPFLLACILAFALKFSPTLKHRMEEVAARAHFLMSIEMSDVPKITTVQGLCVLSNYHGSLRRKHVAAQLHRYARVTLDHFRQQPQLLTSSQSALLLRLEWSIYCFGVYHHLVFPSCFGSLSLPAKPPVAEEHVDERLWPDTSSSGHVAVEGPSHSQRSYESLCFATGCHFYPIMDDILRALSGRSKRRTPPRTLLLDLRDRLSAAQAEVPRAIYIDCSAPPKICPPLHVLFFNLLIRVCWLLLYQPLVQDRADSDHPSLTSTLYCLATEAQHLFHLGVSTYPSSVSFLFIYAAFSGAAIDLDRLRVMADSEAKERDAILRRLEETINALAVAAQTIYGIDESVTLLRQHRDAVAVLGPPCKSRTGPPSLSSTLSKRDFGPDDPIGAVDDMSWLFNVESSDRPAGASPVDWDSTLSKIITDLLGGTV